MSDTINNALQTSKSNMPATIKSLFSDDKIKKRFEEILGKKAQGFMSSVMNVTNNNKLLRNADAQTVMSAAVVAATLDLPIDPNLGFSYIVPYAGKAQFQMGYKGFVQLALRTGQYQKMNAIPVYKNQFKSFNALTETLNADFDTIGEGEIEGYAVYFELVNGFSKTAYFSKKDLLAHGKRYSKTFGNGPWQTNPDEMCLKTAIKKTLTKWGILSIEMQTAIKADQGIIKKDNLEDDDSIEYPDANAIEADYEVMEQTREGLQTDFEAIKQESAGGK
jgi:recombination protein RecT